MRPINIVQLVNSFELGGAENVALNLSAKIGPPQFKSELWCTGGDGPLAEIAEQEGVVNRAFGRSDPPAQCGIKDLARALLARRVDVVHCHGKRAHFRGAVAGALAGVRACVHTRHGLGDVNVAVRPRLLEHLAAPLTDKYVAVSERVLRRAARYRRIVFSKSLVIPNGIDTDLFRPRERERADDALRVGCVARLSEEKRHCVLLRAVADLRRKGVPVRLVLVGDGALRGELEDLARSLGVAGNTEFLGARRDVPELMRTFDVFALSSRSEGLPLTVLEAMASGLPVVSTDVGSIGEVVAQGKTGFLAPPNSPEQLAAALEKVAADGDWRRQAGNLGRKIVLERYSARKMADAHAKLYLDLVPRHREETG